MHLLGLVSETICLAMINWHNPKALRELLKERGMKAEELAALTGISRAHIYRLYDQNSEVKPRWDTDRKIQIALGLIPESGGPQHAPKTRRRKPSRKTYANGTKPKGATA